MFAAQHGLEADLRREATARRGPRRRPSGHVDDGVERRDGRRPGRARPWLDDGRPHAAAPVGRVDRHGDLGAAQVVAQRQLHHARRRGSDRRICRAASRSKRFDLLRCRAKARMSGRVNPVRSGQRSSSLARRTAAPLGQLVVVRWIDPAHLHRTTLPRRPPLSAGRRRTPASRRSMQRARSPPTSSSVSVRSSRAEAQPVGQAARALVDAGAAVDVEEVHGLEQVAAGRRAGRRPRHRPGAGPPPRRPGRCPMTGSG